MPNPVRELHELLLDLMGILNEPQRDDALIARAGISLDRALFPLLVRIERRGPIGVVELADISGRDHTTVSRQVAKLETLGLITRTPGASDARIRQATITKKGRTLTEALDRARESLIGPRLARWSAQDRKDLLRLLRKVVEEAREMGDGE
ncbi:MAG TPA: MarR family transcriptional regulator [Rhizomicrobium sp.]|jgi:DNA-binding MarR family transcriptional regulator